MMSAKMATLGLVTTKVFWNNSYDANEILSRDWNYCVDVVIWRKFDNFSNSMTEVIINSILSGFNRKTNFFEGYSWFKFNKLVLTLVMALTFYTSLAKVLKLKARCFWGLIPALVEVTGKQTATGCFLLPNRNPPQPSAPSWIEVRHEMQNIVA